MSQVLADTLNLSGNLAIGLAAAGAAIGIGSVGSGASQAVGRNPGAFGTILIMAILAIGLSEGTFILVAFVIGR